MTATLRRLTLAALIAAAAWALFTWPLPRHVTTGIAYSGHQPEPPAVRRMASGDHLQLLYHFWLAGDALRGGTPWLSNPYQFNMGTDVVDRDLSEYYFPFAFVYTLGEALGGRAFGWNLTGAVSIWLTFFATWRLARRYSGDEWSAAAGALLGVILPYRWMSLLGGSPTGFDMVLVPLFWLGLDLAIRDGRARGGVLAGLVLMSGAGSDPHVFFFAALSAPAWGLVALATGWLDPAAAPNRAASPHLGRRLWAWMLQALRGLWPAPLLAIVPLLISLHRSSTLSGTGMHQGWPLREMARFSPKARGFFNPFNGSHSDQVFLGLAIPTLILTGFAVWAWRRWRARNPRPPVHGAIPLMLLAGIVGVAALSLGVYGPDDGRLMVWCRKLVPPYQMIRQSAKVYALMPTLLALCVALSVAVLASGPRRRLGAGLAALLLAVGVWEYRSQLVPGICLLDTRQGAYAAVVDDAAAAGLTARALGIPLWPGQSHWTSLNQHYASIHRIRMVNGYSPSVPLHYFDNVFRVFETFNLGYLPDDRLDALLERGIAWLILHEEAFPEQVSPYPAGITRQRLRQHPRLTLLAVDGPVSSYRIHPAGDAAPTPESPAAFYVPTRRWEFERLPGEGGEVVADPSAGGEAGLRLPPEAYVRLAIRGRIGPYPGLAWHWRVRGHGRLALEGHVNPDAAMLDIAADNWQWVRVPITPPDEPFAPDVRLTLVAGEVVFDQGFLGAGEWRSPSPGETRALTPSLMLHNGHTRPGAEDGLRLHPERPVGAAWEGPRLPLDPGRYTVTLHAHAAAVAPGTSLGQLSVQRSGVHVDAATVRSGEATEMTFDWPQNLPFSLVFNDPHEHVIDIHSVTLTRHIED